MGAPRIHPTRIGGSRGRAVHGPHDRLEEAWFGHGRNAQRRVVSEDLSFLGLGTFGLLTVTVVSFRPPPVVSVIGYMLRKVESLAAALAASVDVAGADADDNTGRGNATGGLHCPRRPAPERFPFCSPFPDSVKGKTGARESMWLPPRPDIPRFLEILAGLRGLAPSVALAIGGLRYLVGFRRMFPAGSPQPLVLGLHRPSGPSGHATGGERPGRDSNPSTRLDRPGS